MDNYNPLEGQRPELVIPLHDGSDDQVAIIVVHKDKPELLNICLQSIAVTSFNNNYEIIVVDNGSGKESQDFLDEIEGEVKVIRNPHNIYWGPAANKGVLAANKTARYFIFMHCDVVVLNPGWIDILVSASQSKKSGMIGTELQTWSIRNQKYDFVQEWCLLMTKECWKECGPFPEKLPQIGPAFIMTMKAQQKGYQPQVVKYPICHHYRFFSINPNEYEKLLDSAMVEIPKALSEIAMQAV